MELQNFHAYINNKNGMKNKKSETICQITNVHRKTESRTVKGHPFV